MGSDTAATNASGPAASKDLGGRRKKANRSAKLKQCKLDARREQWLSQVKNKSCKAVDAVISSAPVVISATRGNDQTAANSNLSHLEFMESSSPPNSSHGDLSSTITEGEEFITQEVEEESLDDWEAVADTLTVCADFQISPKFQESAESTRSSVIEGRISRAWRSDDVFRPQSLPNLQNHQRSFSLNASSTCPICYEDLDPTDSSFRPCCCGFSLCLFCHQKILEADGRCPGCRKLYGPSGNGNMGGVPLGSLTLSRSFSMSWRS